MTVIDEQVFVHGKVFTARNESEFVSAFKMSEGKISLIGDANEVDGAGAIDLQGKTVLPGFIDVHTHPTYVAMTLGAVACVPPLVNDIPEMIEVLKEHQNYGKGENGWVEGWGYDESKLAEHRTPTTENLDRVSTTQPVYVLRSDCHSGICNSRALELAGITRKTPDSEGGRFGRYDGKPNGVLIEHGANDVVLNAKGVQNYPHEVSKIAATSEHFDERGIVAITDMMVFTKPYDHLTMYRDAAAGGLKQQAVLYYDWAALMKEPIGDLTDEQRTGRVKLGGIKLFMDGSVSNRTAWTKDPYPDSEDHGMTALTDETIQAGYGWASRNRVQMVFHAMVDRGIEQIIDLLTDKEPWMDGDMPSVRLDHATLLDKDQLRRVNEAKMNFGVVTQIIFFFAEYDSYFQNLSEGQFQHAYPVKTFYEELDRVALSSDAPATTWADPDDVFVSIKAAVDRRAYYGANIVQEGAITVPQAVRLCTARSAELAPYQDVLGQIAEGFEASFIVLDRDIFTIDVEEIDQTLVEQTWIRGEKVFERQ